MTPAELDAIEARASLADIPALVAEVRRLSGLVRETHREGMRAVHSDHIDYDEDIAWESSAARRALEGGA